ncbi:PDZ domain-containing protein [bacterium 1XD8-76]|nr:PDZ domain-containing protein [bacterium 1XD8-76]
MSEKEEKRTDNDIMEDSGKFGQQIPQDVRTPQDVQMPQNAQTPPGPQNPGGQVPGGMPGPGHYGYQNPYQNNWQNQRYYGNDYSRRGGNGYNNYPNQNYGNVSQGGPYGRQGGYPQGNYNPQGGPAPLGNAGGGNGDKKPGSGKKVLPAVCILAVLALCVGVIWSAVYMWGGGEKEEMQQASAQPENPQIGQVELEAPGDAETTSPEKSQGQPLPGNLTDVSELVEKIMPSVVSVNAVYSYNGGYWSGDYKEKYDGGGSGFIIGENETELLIATNSHVVSDTEELEVCFVDETEADAMVKGYDNDLDVAVIAVRLEDISEETKNTILVARLGDSTKLKAGQAVISIGNALLLGQSVTTGIISAVDMPVGGGYDEMGNQYGSDDRVMIQTTAIMNPGCSGGVLVNASGEVVGINTMTISAVDVEGMCYAIPITNAIPVLDKLKVREIRERLREEDSGYLGISCSNVEGKQAEEYDIPRGVYVRDVYEDEPADEAGVRKGDVIVSLNEVPVETMEELSEMLRYYPVGEIVDLEIMRYEAGEYNSQIISVRLGKK